MMHPEGLPRLVYQYQTADEGFLMAEASVVTLSQFFKIKLCGCLAKETLAGKALRARTFTTIQIRI